LLVLPKFDPAPTKYRSVVAPWVWLQTEKVAKESDGRKDTKESFAKMYKDRKIKNPIRGKMIQGYVKKMKETMKKRSRKA
jgi:hypothetical protein